MKDWTERAAEAAREIIDEHFTERDPGFPIPEPARGNGRGLAHLHWMAVELTRGEMSPTKACRWLGYLQAGLIFLCFSDLDAEKARNQRTGDRPFNPNLFYQVREGKGGLGQIGYNVVSNGGLTVATVYGSLSKANALCALFNNTATLMTDEPDFYVKPLPLPDQGWEMSGKGVWKARPAWVAIDK